MKCITNTYFKKIEILQFMCKIGFLLFRIDHFEGLILGHYCKKTWSRLYISNKIDFLIFIFFVLLANTIRTFPGSRDLMIWHFFRSYRINVYMSTFHHITYYTFLFLITINTKKYCLCYKQH